MATTLLRCSCEYLADNAPDAQRHSAAFGHSVASTTFGDLYAARLREWQYMGLRGDYSVADPR